MIPNAESYGLFLQDGGLTILEQVSWLTISVSVTAYPILHSLTLHIITPRPYVPFPFHFFSEVDFYYFLFLFIYLKDSPLAEMSPLLLFLSLL